jgi:hypothetical protein
MTQYATVADLKSYLGLANTGDDTLLAAMLARASQAVDTYTRRTFAVSGDTTRYYDAIGEHIVDGRVLLLDHDLCSVTTVTNGDGNTISSTYYTLVPRNETPHYAIRLKDTYSSLWTYTTSWEDAISITGRWAYSLTPPDDIVQATLRWAGYIYKQKDAQVFDTTAIPDAGVIQIPAGIPADVRLLLRPYKRVNI